MKKFKRTISEKDLKKFRTGELFFVELNMPSSKYHGSIFRTVISDALSISIYHQWLLLDAPDLPRRLSVHYTKVLRTKETVERLTSSPTINKDVEFIDFSGYKIKVGDVLFGEGKLIKVTDIRSTICVITVLHPTLGEWHQKEYRYRMQSIKKFLYIEDPTLVLLKT